MRGAIIIHTNKYKYIYIYIYMHIYIYIYTVMHTLNTLCITVGLLAQVRGGGHAHALLILDLGGKDSELVIVVHAVN